MAELITNIKSSSRQTFKVRIPDGDIATFNIYYLPSQRGWYFDVEYGTFKSTGLHLVNSANVLSAYRNILRWGLSCQTEDGSEPFFVDDLSTGRVKLYLLTDEELDLLEELYRA